MLEAKSKDIALIRLRKDLLRYGPDVAAHFGLHGTPAVDESVEEIEETPAEAD
jgi:UV DNA damage endonuclease